MNSELLDVYDENIRLVGRADRAVVHTFGLWHRTIHCWFVRRPPAPAVLFQQRAADVYLFPNMLDISAAGHYRTGESPGDGVREVIEELGIGVTLEEMTSLGIRTEVARTSTVVNREFCDVFLGATDHKPGDYSPKREEVAGLFEVGLEDAIGLFAHRVATARADGVLGDPSGRYAPASRDVTLADFAPRSDDYYLRVCVAAKRLLAGDDVIGA